MKKWNFWTQILLGVGFGLCLWVTGSVFELPLLFNLSWILFGLLFVIHPVAPIRWGGDPRGKSLARLAGILCIVVGLVFRFGQ